MKILQINAVKEYGSTGRNVSELSKYLSSRQIDNYIAFSEGDLDSKSYKIGTRFEKKVHGFKSRLFGLQGYYSKTGTKRLIKYINEISPDIVHLGNLHANYINLKLLLTYLTKEKIPTVLTLHDCWFYTGNRVHYVVDDCYIWRGDQTKCRKKTSGNKSWFFDRELKMLKDKDKLFKNIENLTVIGVSDWITNEAKQSILKSAREIVRIYNWVDIEIFKPSNKFEIVERLGIQNHFIILGVASVWNESKGIKKFIELSSYLSDDMVIILVGKINMKYDIPPNIISYGEVTSTKELSEIYSSSNVLVNFSIEETFGKVTAESLACGTPVVVNNSTANPELVGDNCGYVIQHQNVEQAYKYINKIKSKSKVHYSKECRKFAVENFDSNSILEEHYELYEKILEV